MQRSLQKVHNFIAAYETQKNVVHKSEKADDEISVKIKGHFSRGINQDDEEEKEEEKDKGYFTRMKEWLSNKLCSKKVNHDKKDEDKKEEEADTKDENDEKSEEDKKKEEKKNQNFDDILTLKDIDLEFKKGEFVCIIGEVGCGKTSLLLSMLGELLYVP